MIRDKGKVRKKEVNIIYSIILSYRGFQESLLIVDSPIPNQGGTRVDH